MPDFKITSGPSVTQLPGRWRLLEAFPEGAWRAKLIVLSQLTAAGRALQLAFEGNSLVFTCQGDREALRQCMRDLNDLVDRTNKGVGSSGNVH